MMMMGPGDASAAVTSMKRFFDINFFYVKFLVIHKMLIEFFVLRGARVVAFMTRLSCGTAQSSKQRLWQFYEKSSKTMKKYETMFDISIVRSLIVGVCQSVRRALSPSFILINSEMVSNTDIGIDCM